MIIYVCTSVLRQRGEHHHQYGSFSLYLLARAKMGLARKEAGFYEDERKVMMKYPSNRNFSTPTLTTLPPIASTQKSSIFHHQVPKPTRAPNHAAHPSKKKGTFGGG